MKINKIIIFFFFISLLSWLLGSFLMINIYKDFLISDLNLAKTNNNKIVKQDLKIVNVRDVETEITSLVKNISPWVVSIVIKKDLTLYKRDPWWFFNTPVWTIKRKIWWWTGFFITKDGYIITNKHVVSDNNSEYSVITNDQKEYSAKILSTDPLTDLAVIKIEPKNNEEFKTLDFIEHEENINIWQFWVAIWNSLAEFQNSVSLWVISWKNRNIDIWDWTKLAWLLQTDAAINPWNSWGPLVNLNWEVMWINTAIVNNTNSLWFSIPLSKRKIEYFLDSIKKYGEIKKPVIWINYLIINDSIKDQLWVDINYWAYILDQEWSVVKSSQAEKAWIEAWDIILSIDNIEINLTNDLKSIIQNKIPWDILNLSILKKDWEQKNIKLELWIDN